MREILTVILAAIGLIGMRLAALVWWLFKLAILAAILIGAVANVPDLTPKVWPPFEYNFDALLAYAKLGYATAVDGWWILALALALVWILSIRTEVERIEKDVGQSKIALVALANYFEIGVETDAMKTLREEGLKSLLRRGKDQFFLSMLLGADFDDRLTAKAVRAGKAAHFRDDLRQTFEK